VACGHGWIGLVRFRLNTPNLPAEAEGVFECAGSGRFTFCVPAESAPIS
jgi:hypothetical protein